MKLSRIIALVRDKLNDQGAIQYKDDEIVRWLDETLFSLFRDHVTASASYSNHFVELTGADAVQIHSDEFEYELPWWVHTVTQVRDSELSTEPRGRTYRPEDDWIWDRRTAIRMRRQSAAPDIRVQVTKVPASLSMGTIPAAVTMAANELVLDLTPTFPDGTAAPANLTIPDAYVNSVVELTGVDTVTPHLVSGQIRRVTASQTVVDAGAVHVKLTLNKDWVVTPTAGTDTYEFHAEMSDSHINILTLKAAERIFQRTNNVAAIQALQPDIQREYTMFKENIEPRDSGNPGFWKTDFEELQRFDPDRADLLGWHF